MVHHLNCSAFEEHRKYNTAASSRATHVWVGKFLLFHKASMSDDRGWSWVGVCAEVPERPLLLLQLPALKRS